MWSKENARFARSIAWPMGHDIRPAGQRPREARLSTRATRENPLATRPFAFSPTPSVPGSPWGFTLGMRTSAWSSSTAVPGWFILGGKRVASRDGQRFRKGCVHVPY
jgi:hypothetical protein